MMFAIGDLNSGQLCETFLGLIFVATDRPVCSLYGIFFVIGLMVVLSVKQRSQKATHSDIWAGKIQNLC